MTTRRTTVATTFTTAVVVGAALAAAGLGREPATAAAPTAVLTVPDQATITVSGHGFGHGHGLSQYGAQGAAAHGLSAKQIVGFYYPHTKTGRVGGRVRVLISADTDDNTTVVNRSGLKVHSLGKGGRTRALPAKGAARAATQWRLSPAASGATRVAYRHHGWHTWRTLPGDAEFTAAQPITLVVGSGRVTYRGSLQSRTPVGAPATHRVTVNQVSLEAYVQGVVPREMPALWHQAALRAQAIAARTYAAFEARSSTNPRWNLCDTSSCQVYGGRSAEFPTSNAAVAATARQVRLFHGAPAFTQFSSSNGGWAADGGEPYLPAQKDPYEKFSGNPNHTWATNVPSSAIEKAWPALGNLTSISIDQRDGHGQWGGRVEQLTLLGSSHDVSVTGDSFRSVLGLRSTWFTLSAAPARSAQAPAARAAAVDYVALGDSYSAGPLIPIQRPDPLGCLRSVNNYPAFLAGYLGVTTYRDVTCSGARVRDFAFRQTPVIPGPKVRPQLRALSKQTDLVTVGIGGNDFGLFGDLTSVCPALALQHPHGAPCRDHFTNARGVNTKYRDATRVQAHVATALREIHRAAPHARVVVVGYPRLLPDRGTCAAAPFARGDYPFARHVGVLLNRSLRRAAAAHRARYVSTYGVSRGHDVCAGGHAWINGPQNTALAAAFHPFEKGERGMARHVFHVLTGRVAPLGGNAMPPPGSSVPNPST